MTHITFIHGIANKPESKELLRRWKAALSAANIPLDIDSEATSSMVYWADVLYAQALSDDEYESAISEESIEGVVGESTFIPYASFDDEAKWISMMSEKLGMDFDFSDGVGDVADAPADTMARELERIPLPSFIKDAFLKKFLRDVHHYLFNSASTPRPGETFKVQDEIRSRFITALELGASKPGPHIVISHSMGTVIAYDCLKRVNDCPKIDALVTIGSPLGIDEIQDKLKPEWSKSDGFPSAKLSAAWQNFYDPLDVVSRLDPKISNDYKKQNNKIVNDVSQSNDGVWRHDIEKYLQGREVSSAISKLLGL